MQKFHRNITLERFDKFTSAQYFQDVNLYAKLYRERSSDAVSLTVSADAGMQRMYATAIYPDMQSVRSGRKGHVSTRQDRRTLWTQLGNVLVPRSCRRAVIVDRTRSSFYLGRGKRGADLDSG
jgi:hypothetical protein